MFIYRNLFLQDSSFIKIFCYYRDMQVHASLCNFLQYYASLLLLFFIPCPEGSPFFSQSKMFFCFSYFSWSREFFYFLTFHCGLSLRLEVASASKQIHGRQSVVTSLPFLLLWMNRSTGRRWTFAKQKRVTGSQLSDRWSQRDLTSIHRPQNWINQGHTDTVFHQ